MTSSPRDGARRSRQCTWLVAFVGLATLGLALSAGGARSANQASPWLNTGPRGGSFAGWAEPIAIHPKNPQVVYGSSWNGLFRSTDGGASWRRRPAPRYLWDIALHSEDSQTIYAIADRGLYRTTNAGSNWALLPPPSGGFPHLLAVAVSPSSPNVIYSVGGIDTREGGRVALWSSTDSGESWLTAGKIDAAADYQPVVLLVDPAEPSTVYVWVLGKGIFRSSDGGATWTSVNAGLPIGRLSSFAEHPTKSGLLFAGTERGEVFRSDDSGQSWTVAASALAGDVVALSVSAADGAVYAGTSVLLYRADGVERGGGVVYRSADGRAPWRAARSGLTGWYVAALAAHPTKPGAVLAGTEHGIFLSRDGGVTWAPRLKGLVATTPTGLAVDPSNPRVAFAAVERGVAVSRDGGRTWSDALDVRRERATIGPLLAVPGKPSTLYAVKYSYAAPKTRWTLLASRNAGRSWEKLGALPAPVRLLVADPSQPATLYALRGGTQYQGWHRGGIFKSVNGGRSWTPIYSLVDKPPASAFAVDPYQPGTLYAVAARRNAKSHLFRSENGGRTWRRLGEVGAFQLVVDPHKRRTLYALQGGWVAEVNVSRDGGRTWAKLGQPPISTSTLLVDPVRPGILYVGTQNGAWVKLRGSTTWRSAGPAGRHVRWLATDSKASRLYAGIDGGGVAATRLPLTGSLER